MFKFSFAGLAVHCRQAAPEQLAWLKRTYQHLGLPSEAPCELALELHLQPPPSPPTDGPELSWDTFEGALAKYHQGAQLWLTRPGQAFCLDQSQGLLQGWMTGIDSLTRYQRVKPLYLLLSIWAQQRQRVFLHAAFLAQQGRGVALVGQGGSGKSTSSFSAWWGGWNFLGDDVVALEVRGDELVGHSLWSSLCLEPDHCQHLARSLGMPQGVEVEPCPEEKSAVYLPPAHASLLRQAPLSAWVAPRITPGRLETRLVRCHPAEMLRLLAPSTMLQMMPRPHPGDFQKMARWVGQYPCYRLELGSDLKSIPTALEQVFAPSVGLLQ